MEDLSKYRCHSVGLDCVGLFVCTANALGAQAEDATALWKSLSSIELVKEPGAIIHPDGDFSPIRVDGEYLRKHSPKAGGYYVVYADGYASFSPPEPFEAGYTRI
jgi:hypothetical protein